MSDNSYQQNYLKRKRKECSFQPTMNKRKTKEIKLLRIPSAVATNKNYELFSKKTLIMRAWSYQDIGIANEFISGSFTKTGASACSTVSPDHNMQRRACQKSTKKEKR